METVRDFDLIQTLRTMPKYQLSSGSLVVEDYTQQNRNLATLIVLSNQETQVYHWSLATKLSKNAWSPNLSPAPLTELLQKVLKSSLWS